MPTPVTVYRWDDEGAPQLIQGSPVEWFNLFKKCLVEGYGQKPAAGWLLVEEQANPPCLTFQNDPAKGASGGYIVLKAAGTSNAEIITAQGCLDYVSFDQHSRNGAKFRFGISSTNEQYARKNWILVASTHGFYFFSFANYQMSVNFFNRGSHNLFYVGDYFNHIPNDPTRFFTISGNYRESGSLDYNENASKQLHLGAYGTSIVYPLDGSPDSQNSYFSSIFGSPYSRGYMYVDATPEISMMSPLVIVTGDRKSNTNDSIRPTHRGLLPGLFVSLEYGYGRENMPFLKSIGNTNYLAIPHHENNSGTALWLNLESW